MEDDRECVCNSDRFSFLPAWCPFRRQPYDSHGLVVKRWINSTEDLYVSNRTINIDGELKCYTSLDAVILSDVWIFKLSVDPYGELVRISTLE